MIKIDELIAELSQRISPEAAAALQRISEQPEVQAFVTREEERLLDERRRLVKELAALPEKRRAEAEAAAEARSKAERALRDARAAVAKAQEDHMAVVQQDTALYQRYESAYGALRSRLIAEADPRLEQAVQIAQMLSGIVRHLVNVWPIDQGSNGWGGRIFEWGSNLAQVNATLEALDDAVNTCREMQQQALSRAQVTESLGELFFDACAVLAPFEVPTPYLDEDGTPKLDFTGRKLNEVIETAARASRGDVTEAPVAKRRGQRASA